MVPSFLSVTAVNWEEEGAATGCRDPRASPSCLALTPPSCCSAAFAVCDSARSGEECEHRRCQLDYRSSQRDPLVSVHDALLPAPACGAPPDQRCVGGPSSPKNAGDRRPNSGTGAVRARRSAAETGDTASVQRLAGAHGAAKRRRANTPECGLTGRGPRTATLRGPARRSSPSHRRRGRAARTATRCSTPSRPRGRRDEPRHRLRCSACSAALVECAHGRLLLRAGDHGIHLRHHRPRAEPPQQAAVALGRLSVHRTGRTRAVHRLAVLRRLMALVALSSGAWTT